MKTTGISRNRMGKPDRTSRSGLDFNLDLDRMFKLGLGLEAYHSKHKRDVKIWRYLLGNGEPDPHTWSTVQDRFGKTIIGEDEPLKVGDRFEFKGYLMRQHNKKRLPIFALVVKQVSMADAEKLARCRLPERKRYCYEVVVD